MEIRSILNGRKIVTFAGGFLIGTMLVRGKGDKQITGLISGVAAALFSDPIASVIPIDVIANPIDQGIGSILGSPVSA